MSTQTARGTALREGPAEPTGRAPGQLWQVPTFFAGLLAVLAVAASIGFSHTPPAVQLKREISTLREALGQPRTPPKEMLPLAEHILTLARTSSPKRVPEAHLLLGIVHARLADRCTGEQARDERQEARNHLDQAATHGLPPEDVPRLNYYLGKLLYQSGGDLRRVIEYLSRNTAQGAENPAEGYAMLTQAYLRLRPPDIEAALLSNHKQIELENSDDQAVLAPAYLRQAELLLGKGQRADALKYLSQIRPTAPANVRLKARFLQARCAQEEGLYGEAMRLWDELLKEPSSVPGGKAHILYALGICHTNAEPRDETRATACWKEAAGLGGTDGQAAALRLAELAMRQSENQGNGKDPGAVLRWFRTALEKVASPKDYQNFAVTIDQARELCETGCRMYRDGQDHERAMQLAQLYRRIALPGVADEYLAQTAEAWAEALAKKASQGVAGEAATDREQAQKLYRQAGAAFEQAAAGRTPAKQAIRLRHAARCYLQAQSREDQTRAAALLQQFIKQTPEPERKAEGWFALAGTYRALRDNEQAKKAYYACIQYPQSQQATRARLELAELQIEQGNMKEAEEILQQNVSIGGSSSGQDEESLYRLGELYFRQREYEKAVFRLDKAIQSYPHNPRALLARDMLGTCYSKLAELAKKDPDKRPGNDDPPLITRSLRREYLEKAWKTYESLADDLVARAAVTKLSSLEDALLRRAQFMATDCLFELPDNFSEAVRRYSKLAEQYRGRVESLWACQRLVHYCFLVTSDLRLFREAAEAAKVALRAALQDVNDPSAMPDEAFRVPGNEIPREQWRTWLTATVDALDRIPSRPPPQQK